MLWVRIIYTPDIFFLQIVPLEALLKFMESTPDNQLAPNMANKGSRWALIWSIEQWNHSIFPFMIIFACFWQFYISIYKNQK